MSHVQIVHNKLLGGWYIVRGPHQTPLAGRFDSKAEAQAHLQNKQAARDARTPRYVRTGGIRFTTNPRKRSSRKPISAKQQRRKSKRAPSPAQLRARKKFVAMVRARAKLRRNPKFRDRSTTAAAQFLKESRAGWKQTRPEIKRKLIGLVRSKWRGLSPAYRKKMRRNPRRQAVPQKWFILTVQVGAQKGYFTDQNVFNTEQRYALKFRTLRAARIKAQWAADKTGHAVGVESA